MSCIGRMTNILLIYLSIFSAITLATAEQLPTPNPGDFTGFTRKLEPDRFLTTGGLKVTPGTDVTVEPEFGVSHVRLERELVSGVDDITHKVHAQAGGKVKLSDSFYLGFATKLPIYNYGSTEGRSPGGTAIPSAQNRHEYEILKLSPSSITWTGEAGVRLGQRFDLNLYYDRNLLKGPSQKGISSDEEVIGTRFIIRFK